MWTYQHSMVTNLAPESIWTLYVNISKWILWDKDLIETKINGTFSKGVTGYLTSKSQETLPFVLTEVRENEYFSNLTKLDSIGIEIEFSHCLEIIEEGTKVTHGVKITGTNAATLGKKIGSNISRGIPESMANLISLATEG